MSGELAVREESFADFNLVSGSFWGNTQSRLLEPIGDAETIICGKDDLSVTIPDGFGKLAVASECGKWKGEIQIIERAGERFIDWLRMTSPKD